MILALGDKAVSRERWSAHLESSVFALMVAILAWAPFPLGSNRPWSWSLLALLVSVCWIFWTVSYLLRPVDLRVPWKYVAPLLVLLGIPLLWAGIQILPVVPQSWAHPVWSIASDILARPVGGRISIDPWRTATELMKLLTYVMTACLVFLLCRRPERAEQVFSALLVIFLVYAVYGLLLTLIDFSQNQIFYPGWGHRDDVSGPFISRNNYATYLAFGLCMALARLYPAASGKIITTRGARQHILSTLQFIVGRGIWTILTLVVILSVLIATESRAGFLAALSGLAAILLCAILLAGRKATSRWAMAGFGGILALSLFIFSLSGDALQSRFHALVEAGGLDTVRAAFWDAASRMISDAPLLGLGLGTFERAYPLYAEQMLPFVMDKAHNDYLEFAAGVGLPAALVWWSAIIWCVSLCARALFIRRRNRIYSVAALGTTAVIAFHSAFDFSLQIPAVALTFAAILGLGLAQAFPSRDA